MDHCSQQAFDGAKAPLASAPVLVALDFSQPFCLTVDASEPGAVLLMKSQDGVRTSNLL